MIFTASPQDKQQEMAEKTKREEQQNGLLFHNRIKMTFPLWVLTILSGWINFPPSFSSLWCEPHTCHAPHTLMFINFFQQEMP